MIQRETESKRCLGSMPQTLFLHRRRQLTILERTLTDEFAALHLGIHTTEIRTPVGYVIVSHGCIDDTRGWGFGHLAFIDDQQGWGWDSDNRGHGPFHRTPLNASGSGPAVDVGAA